MAQVIDAGNERATEQLAICSDASDRHAAEVRAMIAALASYEARLRGVAAHAVIGDGDLQRRVDRFRPGVGEEDIVESGRRYVDEARGALERHRMPQLERAGEIELARLAANRLDDLRPAVSGVDAPQARGAIEDACPVRRYVAH